MMLKFSLPKVMLKFSLPKVMLKFSLPKGKQPALLQKRGLPGDAASGRASPSPPRTTWSLNPMTRKAANPKTYHRKTARNWKDDSNSVPVYISFKPHRSLYS